MRNTHWWRAFGVDSPDPFGGPFNGQQARLALFEALLGLLQPAALVETGCDLGSTTELFAKTGLPVYSVEWRDESWRFTKFRVFRMKNAVVEKGDSRDALRRWLEGPLRAQLGDPLFFYLDAHGHGSELPLAQEVDLIYSYCPKAVVMVDDFLTPGDAGYGYDDYGPGHRLDEAYLEAARAAYELTLFYPSTLSEEETGCRRGCVVLAGAAMAPQLLSLGELRRC